MENKKTSGRTILAHVVLIILAFLCLFFFYILIVNATRSHAQLQLGFSALPGSSLITNFLNVINDPAIPILKGIQNQPDRHLVVRHGLLGHVLVFARGLVSQHRTFDTDSFAQAFCHYALVGHIDQLIFQGRTSAVNN